MCPGIKYDFHSMVMDMSEKLNSLMGGYSVKIADDIAKAAANVEKHKKLAEDEMERLKKENEDIKDYCRSNTFLEDLQNDKMNEDIKSKILKFASNKARMETQTDMLDHIKTAIESNNDFKKIFLVDTKKIVSAYKWIFLAVYEKRCDDKEEISRKIREELVHRNDRGEILFFNIVFLAVC